MAINIGIPQVLLRCSEGLVSALVEFIIIFEQPLGRLVELEIRSDLSASKTGNCAATRVLGNFSKDRDANEGGSC